MTDPAPRVSVIVPAYNYGAYLADAAESVLAQTLSDWECIIVDDGSTDDTEEVARRYTARDARFRYVRQQNAGPAAARNNALRLSRGTYIQLLDADDKLAPAKLELHATFLDSHPDVDVVYSLATYFRTEEPEKVLYSLHGHLSRPLMQKVTSREQALARLQEFNIMPADAVLFRRRVVDRVGVFNEASRGCEDWDFWLRCAIAGCEFRYVEASSSTAFVRTHPSSVSKSSDGMLRALVGAARTFHLMPAAQQWPGTRLPRVYEMACGIDDVMHGKRWQGVRRIWYAARSAHSTLTRLRWTVYAAAASLLPRRLFHRVVTWPMPERGLEFLRRLRF